MKHRNFRHVPFLLLILFGLALIGGRTAIAQEDAAFAKAYINGTTMIVAKIDTKRAQLPDKLVKMFAGSKGNTILNELESIRKSLNGEPLYVMVDFPYSHAQTAIRIVFKNKSGIEMEKLKVWAERYQFATQVQGEYVLVSMQAYPTSTKIAIEDNVLASTRPDLAPALQASQEYPVQIAILPPDYLWQTFRDLMPTLPPKLGGGSSSVLTEGVRWGSIGIDPAKLQIHASVQSRSEGGAKIFAEQFPRMLAKATEALPLADSRSSIQALLKLTSARATGDRVTIDLNGLQELSKGTELVSSFANQLLGPLSSRAKMDQLKQMVLAVHNYESANRVLPPNKEARNADGKSGLSWRVHILPYIGEVKLYGEFNLKEAWNSEHNLKLLDKMPKLFKSSPYPFAESIEIKPGYTTFVAPIGVDTIFGGVKPVKLGDIQDGTSNTIFFVEVKAERAVPWTSTEDYAFDMERPGIGLALDKDGNFLAANGDGSVQTFPGNLPSKTLIHLFQKNDGQVIELPK